MTTREEERLIYRLSAALSEHLPRGAAAERHLEVAEAAREFLNHVAQHCDRVERAARAAVEKAAEEMASTCRRLIEDATRHLPPRP